LPDYFDNFSSPWRNAQCAEPARKTCGANTFGFRLAGMVGHDFFKRYAVTFDFETMQIFLQ
jgi:hypothetical protein